MIKLDRPPCPCLKSLKKNYKHSRNKTALKSASYGKCMYCECKVDHVYPGDIEHIKPKSKFKHLEFEWDNLGYVCSICNNKKGDHFDLDTPLINPYDEYPEKYITFSGTCIMEKRGSERGDLTIKIIDLNRKELVEKRLEKQNQLRDTINHCFRSKNQRDL